jgi:hypothetical protein
MSTVEFFESCYKYVKDEYYKVLSKPTTSRRYVSGYRKIMNDLSTAYKYDEITKNEYNLLLNKFRELDYEAYKERMKKAGM